MALRSQTKLLKRQTINATMSAKGSNNYHNLFSYLTVLDHKFLLHSCGHILHNSFIT